MVRANRVREVGTLCAMPFEKNVPGESRVGARAGVIIGVHGWLIGIAIVCFMGGYHELLIRVLGIGIPVSAAMSVLTIVWMECLLRLGGRGKAFGFGLLGMVLFLVGILILLANHGFAPMFEATPGFVETLESLQAVYKTSDVVPAVCLLASCVLLLVSGRAISQTDA